MSIIIEEEKEDKEARVARQGKCHMDLRVEITDSKIYVLWLAKRKGREVLHT